MAIKLTDESDITVHSSQCHGCLATDTDIMVSITNSHELDGNNKPVDEDWVSIIHDIFLSNAQAKKLLEELTKFVDIT